MERDTISSGDASEAEFSKLVDALEKTKDNGRKLEEKV